MNHGGHLITAQASAPNSAPTSYTTSRDTIWTEAAIGIGAAIKATSIVSKGVDQSTAIGKINAATYHDFVPNGLVPSSHVMITPQAQLLMKEIQSGSPGLSDAMVKNIAQEIIQSGRGIPHADVASTSTVLVKVVPKGAGVSDFSPYWMSVEQAKIIANSTPEKAAQILGLPAAQAGKMFAEGMDFFAISPKVGLQLTIFKSDIAGTTQGNYTTAPKAQQIIVPNRGQWNPAAPIDPATFK
ncbi:hypothetical protein [Massilia sp. H6]|uniref:hypothetical protein n=1 Tax=Massilia sp. H6 TaxID=2970464 RepID=UPI002167F4D2|nr:hypothetical protein [Massilia sp. H6]UVW27256.1 hypothetical protein NRS07_11845 [Massilia sp. H6]